MNVLDVVSFGCLALLVAIPVTGFFLARRRNRRAIEELEDGPDLENLDHWN